MKKLIFPFALVIVLALSGCVRAPISCFEPDAELVDVGQSVHFTNCSFNAAAYDWDFGDGTTSTNVHPDHTFTSPGTYKVLLTITNRAGETATSAQLITAGERTLSFIRVNSIPTTNPNGQPWDAGDAADLQFAIGTTSNQPTWDLETDVKTDLSAGIPFLWDVSASNYLLEDENISWELRDEDGGINEIIGFGNFNTYDVGGGDEAKITLTSGAMEVELLYEVN